MYCIKRTTPTFVTDEKDSTTVLAYFKYDGWEEHSNYGQSLDLTGVVLFTEGERKANVLPLNEEYQWHGAYKR